MRKAGKLAAVAVAGVALALSGCDKRGPPQLILYCGAGIRPAASALIAEFEKKTGIVVNANYAGSGRQLGQMSVVQKGDLFMPGAELYVDIAVDKGLADAATKRIVMYFVPVIFVRKGNPKGIGSVKDLTREGLRLGLGDERSCAIGRKTLKILEKNAVPWAEIEPNVVYMSGTVNELPLAIELGNVDAVIAWDANARHFAAVGTVVPIPLERNSISAVPIAVLKSSKHPAEAKRFIEFVMSDSGRNIIRERGYTLSLGPEAAGEDESPEPERTPSKER